jgi:metal-responsive CopG/Arc/MetJ family transcriptional regulator
MAKVMISFPDELLERLDAHARQRGTTRSGLLQTLAERELEASAAGRRERILALMADPRPQGGNSAELVRKARRSR